MGSIVVLSTGISDLITALSALKCGGLGSDAIASEVTAVILGHGRSLPGNLTSVYRETARKAFDLTNIYAFKWDQEESSIAQFVASRPAGSIVASNQLQDPKQREIIVSLKPSQLLFYDNGLSSYHEHSIDLDTWIARMPQCTSFLAYLTYADTFGIPKYLGAFDANPLPMRFLKEVIERVRNRCLSRSELLPPNSVVILGTSFYRGRTHSWEEERDLHLSLLNNIRENHDGPVFFKPHPRAESPFLDETVGVALLSTELPIEAYVTGPHGSAYSFSSTALVSLKEMYGWRTVRVSSPLIEKVFTVRTQLSKIKMIDAPLHLEGS